MKVEKLKAWKNQCCQECGTITGDLCFIGTSRVGYAKLKLCMNCVDTLNKKLGALAAKEGKA